MIYTRKQEVLYQSKVSLVSSGDCKVGYYHMILMGKKKLKRPIDKLAKKFNFLAYDMGNSLCFTCVVSWLKKVLRTEFPFGPRILTVNVFSFSRGSGGSPSLALRIAYKDEGLFWILLVLIDISLVSDTEAQASGKA